MKFKFPHRSVALLIAALLFSLSFVPSPFWFLVYFFVPTFIAATRDLGFRQGFKSGYVFGVVISVLTLYWVANVTIIGAIAMIVAHSLYYAIIAGLLGGITQRFGLRGLALLPFIWVGIEYLRSLSQVSFPWLNLSYTQAENLPLIQIAELSGDATVSFFIVLMGVLLYLGYRTVRSPLRASIYFGVALMLYTTVYFWGASRFQPVTGDFMVSALQGNIPIEEKWRQGTADHNFEIYEQLSDLAKSDSAKFVLWPETAAPSYLIYEPAHIAWIESISRRLDIDILTGALQLVRQEDASKNYYNSAFFVSPSGMDRVPYNKQFLVPFAEHMPYADEIGFLDSFRDFVKTKLGLDISDFSPGDSLRLFRTNGKDFGILICFEVIYPGFVREVVNSGAQFLTVITNDDWFGRTAGPYQHAAIPIFRAIENRIWVLRAANTGISEIIDPIGRVVAKTKLGERTRLSGRIGDRLGETNFLRHGPMLSNISLVVTLLAGLLIIVTRGRVS